MKKFFVKTLFLLIAILLFNNMLNLALVSFFRGDMYSSKEYSWLKNLKARPDVLLMGASSVLYGVSPGIISQRAGISEGRIVNLAGNARTPQESYYVFKSFENYIADHPIVFYGLDPIVLSRSYYANDHLMPIMWSLCERFFYACFTARQNDLFNALFGGNTNAAIRDIFNKKEKKDIPNDFGARQIKPGIKLNTSEKPYSQILNYKVYKLSEEYFQYLARLKSEIEARGGQFILFLPPVTNVFYENYKSECKDYDSDLVHHLNKYLGDVKVTGSLTLIPKDKEEAFFADSAHCNADGQKFLSEYFSKILLQLNAINRERVYSLVKY